MTIVELVILFLLFFTGFFFISAFSGDERILRNLAGAFPMGCCLWGSATFLTAALPLLPKNVYGLSLPMAMAITGLIAMTTLLVSAKRHIFTRNNIFSFVIGFSLLSLFYGLFLQMNFSVMSGDSLYHIHPQSGMKAWMSVRGFNSTLAALAGLTGQDRYFFQYHPLFAISLLLLMGECIFHEVKSTTTRLYTAICASIVGPMLMASCHITAINAFYVNNHMLVAVLIVLALSILVSDNETEGKAPEVSRYMLMVSLAVTTVSSLSLLRLEGLHVALLLLIIMLGQSNVKHTIRLRAFMLLAVLTCPFLLLMTLITETTALKVNFTITFLVTLSLPIIFSLKTPTWVLHLQEQSNKYAVIGIGIGVMLFFLINFEKMIRRFGQVLHNSLDESYWGFTHQTLFVAVLVLLGVRFLFPDPKMITAHRRIDLLLLFYFASLLFIVFLLNFHGARAGWSDSQNRMLFHFLPAGILWVSIQAGFGITRNTK